MPLELVLILVSGVALLIVVWAMLGYWAMTRYTNGPWVMHPALEFLFVVACGPVVWGMLVWPVVRDWMVDR